MPTFTVPLRLLLLAAVPILALSWLAWQDWRDAAAEVELCTSLIHHADEVAAHAEVVQALQRERGMSAVTLNGGNVDLAGQRSKGDGVMAALQDAKARAGFAAALATLRTQVDNKGPVGEVIAGYTRLIDEVLTAEAASAKEHDEFGIGRLYGSVLILEQAKEQAGRLRARLAAAAAADKPVTLAEVKLIAGAMSGVVSGMSAKAIDLPAAAAGK
ncbi:MAG: nitrate- and nitrite sensing domain-containing protein, partial [Planctomycetes bacterium]|nr:nitrate- and nitrite sensing domain-containing protein [Planctomycetota bacterium]